MILEGDHVLQGLVTPNNKRGVAKGGRGKRDKRKRGRAVRSIVREFRIYDMQPTGDRKVGVWV